jgi:hypothetical protein
MSDIDELVVWLRGVLDEDERVARTLDGEGWSAQGCDIHGMRRVTVDYSAEYVVACTLAVRGEHIALHDPAAVLADIEAKRRVLDEQARLLDGATTCDHCDLTHEPAVDLAAVLLRLLAMAYANRPGYREEWRPAQSA